MDNNQAAKILGDASPFFNGHKAGVNFATAPQQSNSYAVSISNAALPADANAGVRKIILFPGALGLTSVLPGILKDGAFNDANGNAGVSASTSEEDQINVLQAYLLSRPTILKGIHFQFSRQEQTAQALVVRAVDPFNNRANDTVRLQTQFNQFSNNQTTLYLPFGKVIGAGKAIEYTLLPGAGGAANIVTMTFDFGMSFDPEMLLSAAEMEAMRYVSQVGEATIQDFNARRQQSVQTLLGS